MVVSVLGAVLWIPCGVTTAGPIRICSPLVQVRAASWRLGIGQLSQNFLARAKLLSDAIDGNEAAMANVIDRLSGNMREPPVQ